METVEVPVTDRMDAISKESGVTVNFRICNATGYHQADFFLRNEQIENLDISLHDVSFPQRTPLCASFRM